MKRSGLTLALATAACHPTAPPAATSQPAASCYERYAPYLPGDHLDCGMLALGTLGPLMAGEGRVRMVFLWPVPGVPAATPDAGFYILDLTPDGETLVATGSCPDSGEPEAMSWDGAGRFHLICSSQQATVDKPDSTDDFVPRLSDLVLGADGKLTPARPPLVLEPDASAGLSLTVAYPADGVPYVIYATVSDRMMPLAGGPTHVRRWADDAPAYAPVVGRDSEEGATSSQPSAVIVDHGVVQLIVGVGSYEPAEHGRAWSFRLVELGPTAPVDRGALSLGPAPNHDCGEGTTSYADGNGLDVLVPLYIRAGQSADEVTGRIHFDHARAVPAPSSNEPPVEACKRRLDTYGARWWAVSCRQGGCVSAAANPIDRVKVHRDNWGR